MQANVPWEFLLSLRKNKRYYFYIFFFNNKLFRKF